MGESVQEGLENVDIEWHSDWPSIINRKILAIVFWERQGVLLDILPQELPLPPSEDLPDFTHDEALRGADDGQNAAPCPRA
ncbi:hypothetical protein AVEN_172668-1 [Araneus ventricosus]|uniref:Uncharacterized protein n=1 Tax=Araneus ventricosus TaxID=182803 RepID=A0A4Y2HKQ8_ARAVE|nr:hypothetical protein AVEN_172668-1 [Araneus ventricosus]